MNVFDDAALFPRIEMLPESGCWIWMLKTGKDGYGVTTVRGRHRMAHRAVFEYRNGVKIPDGMQLCHRCDVRSCVNPDHLYIGTAKDNAQDKVKKGRCHKGEQIFLAKSNPEMVKAIRQDIGSYEKLGKKYGLSAGAIRLIRLGITWRHVA